MLRSTLSIATLSLCIACTTSCSKNKSEYVNTDESSPFQDDNPHVPNSAVSDRALLHMAIASASSSLINSDPPEDPSATLECPSTSHWSNFDAFGALCGYAWTTDASQLPSPPEWQPCADFDDIPQRICKQLKRSRRLKSFSLGLNSSKELQIGFVEPCAPDQIVLADIDGPTRLAIRRKDVSSFPTTCQMKLLAVDMGQWLAAIGGHEVPANLNTSGYTSTGAFIGGEMGSAPTVLLADSVGPFHVTTSAGSILPDGWIANGKRRHWNGKPIEKVPRIGLQRLTKRLFVDEHKGFYLTIKSEPELLLEIPKGNALSSIQIWGKQIIWQEQATEHSIKTCTIVAGEIDAHDSLVSPRRMAEVPCTATKFVLGCNSVLMSNETHLSLLSLSNGSSRTLRVKGHAVAVNCKEAFIERAGTLLRIDLQAFGPTKAPSSPPTELRMRTGRSGTNVLTQH